MQEGRMQLAYVFREAGKKRPRYYKGPDPDVKGGGEVLTPVKDAAIVWVNLSKAGREEALQKVSVRAGVEMQVVWVWGEPNLMVPTGMRQLKWTELTKKQYNKLKGGDTPMAPKQKATKKARYKVGDKTPAGTKITRVYEDTSRDHHRQRLVVTCLVTGKKVDIAVQDAFQVKFHKSVTAAERRAFLGNGKAPAKKKTKAKAAKAKPKKKATAKKRGRRKARA